MHTSNVLDAPVLSQDKCLQVTELAALKVAGSKLSKVRDDLQVGQHAVFAKLLVSGQLEVREDVDAHSSGDAVGVLAFILSKLSNRQLAKLTEHIATHGVNPSKLEREVARQMIEPTRKPIVRRGAVSGLINVEVLS